VRSVDFASLTYREQLKIIRSTDILLGAHGAALSHMILLPTTSVTIEFWIDDRSVSLPAMMMMVMMMLVMIDYPTKPPH